MIPLFNLCTHTHYRHVIHEYILWNNHGEGVNVLTRICDFLRCTYVLLSRHNLHTASSRGVSAALSKSVEIVEDETSRGQGREASSMTAYFILDSPNDNA
jgi:hypothetical protein